MIKFIGIVFFLFCQNVVCQEYHFDKAILYIVTNIKENNTQYLSIFVNSKNQSYYFINQSWGNEINSYLVDNNTKISHKYNLESLKNATDFKYESSTRLIPRNKEINCEKFVTNEIKLDSLHIKIDAINFTTKKKKQIVYHYIFILKPVNFPILNLIIKTAAHAKQLDCLELTVSQNNIPSSVKIYGNKGFNLNFELLSIKDTNATFSVKQEDLKFN